MSSVSKLASRCLVLGCVLFAACGTDSTGSAGPGPDAGAATDAGSSSDGPAPTDLCTSVDTSAALTYTQLYANWFASGKPGGCAGAACHGNNANNGNWMCGQNAATCFAGMKGVGLINTASPKNSQIISPTTSPLAWFSTGGNMPQNNPVANADGKKAVLAWVCAGAMNN
jgi:hypothetical protein